MMIDEYIKYMNENIILEKCLDFSVRIYKLTRYLQEEKKEIIIGQQILKSGTSIGANVAESIRAESPSDFVHKLGISSKEGEETIYWLRLLHRIQLITDEQFESMKQDADELMRLITSSIKTTKNRIKS